MLSVGKSEHLITKWGFIFSLYFWAHDLHFDLVRVTWNWYITKFIGGPVIGIDREGEVRHVLVGTVHGAFSNCKKYLPGIFVEVDDYSVLKFLQAEVFGSGLYKKNTLKISQCDHEY